MAGSPTVEKTDYTSLAAPILADGAAIVHTGDALLGIDLDDLSRTRDIPVDVLPTITPARCSSIVAFHARSNVVAYDLESESRAWTLPARSSYSASASPAALGSHFVLQDGNRLRLVEHDTGTVVWRETFDAGVEGFAASTESVVVNRTAGEESTVVALDPATGERRWSVSTEPSTFHPVIGESVFALSKWGRLVAIDQVEGDEQWSVDTGALDPASMAVTGEYVVVGPDVRGTYVGISAADGSQEWKQTVEYGNPPVVTDHRVFVPDANTGLLELALATGSRLRTHSGARFVQSLVPTESGFLYTQEANDRLNLLSSV